MPNGYTGYGQYSDPIGMQGGTSLDPIGMGMPAAMAPIGTGVTPPVDPAQAAATMQTPVSGMPDMPVLPPPTTSQKLIAAGLAMINADQNGIGLGGSLGAGMQAYNDQLTGTSEKAMKARQQQLQEYELMARIADRHNTELAMQRKLTAGQKIKAQFPQYADMYDADPEAALKLIAAKYPNGAPDPSAPDNSGLSGQAYLDTLDKSEAARVKAIAQGQYDLNKRSKTYNQDLEKVLQYDPEATEINLAARKAVRKTFTSGVEGRTANALNTVIGHIGGLYDKVDSLDNGEWQPVNYIKNKYKEAHGDPKITNFETNAKAVADEVVKVWRASGGSVADIEEAQKNLSSSKSPEQLRGALGTLTELLHSKLNSLNDQYKNGMGLAADDKGILTPEAIKTLEKMGFTADMKAAGDAPTAAAAAAPAAPVGAQSPIVPAAAPIVPAVTAPAAPTQQQIEYTAKKHGLTVDQVKAKLGIK